MSSGWRIRQFGGVAIEGLGFEAGDSIFETQRSAKLLTLLALVRHGKMRRDDLADALWPDDYYDATRLRLRKELSRLRQALGPAAEALQTDSDTVRLDRSLIETDVEILRRTAAIPEGDPRREARLREAAKAVEGEFLPGWDDPWAVAERHAAESLKARILVALGEILFAEGDMEGTLATVRSVIEIDPCHEGARMLAIRAHAALGSLTAAVAEFQGMRRSMRERNDSAPSADAEALFEQVQKGSAVPSPTVPASVEAFRLPALSPSLDRFFGRREEMTALVEQLSPTGSDRLVTLLGAGGMGKSRLANEAALMLREAYGGNVAFISLVESPSPSAAAATLLAHLGWQGSANADPGAVVAASLPEGPCLFVLDNLEHLLPEAADLVRRLLEACPSLRILATSRQSLRLAGERILPLGPLGEDAAEMMADLARAMRPGLDDDPGLAELARRLDGIPLALRLAAPRLRVLNPSDMLARLDDRFRLLQSDAPDLPTRHRSLEAALDGSFEALGERERRVLAWAAPFRGGWTLAHLDRILPDDDGLAAMEALVDASLASLDDRGTTVRFQMLETVREYVGARATPPEAQLAFARSMADELHARLPHPLHPRRLATFNALDAEVDNLHLAIESSIASDPEVVQRFLSRLWVYDNIRARHADVERFHALFERAHPGLEPTGPVAIGRAMAQMGVNMFQEAAANFRRAEVGLRQTGDLAVAAFAEAIRRFVELKQGIGTIDETLERFDVLRKDAETSPNVRGRFAVIEGEFLFHIHRLEPAVSRFDDALRTATEIGDEVGVIFSTLFRALILLDLEKGEEVRKTLLEIAPSLDRLRDPGRRAVHQDLLGRTAMRLGEPAVALGHFQRAREDWTRLGNMVQVATQDNSSARALLELGRPEEALRAGRAAAAGWWSVEDHGGKATTLHTLAAIQFAIGDTKQATETLAAARDLMAEKGLDLPPGELRFVQSLPFGPAPESGADLERLFSV